MSDSAGDKDELSSARRTQFDGAGGGRQPTISLWGRGAISLLLFALAAGIYLPSLNHPFFVVDDGEYVFNNPLVQGGLSPAGVWITVSEFQAANWHPLTWWSLMLDTTLFGTQPAAYRITNFLLHAANGVLLFWLMLDLTGSWIRASLVAALFAVHPQHVESVVWISERKDVLCGFFGILSLLMYVRYTRRPSTSGMILVGLTLFAGLLAKQMLVTWPLLFLILDLGPLRRVRLLPGKQQLLNVVGQITLSRAFLEKIPLFGLCGVFSIIVFLAQRAGGAVGTAEKFPFSIRLGTSIVAVAHYLVQSLFPIELSFYYPYPAGGFSGVEISLCAMGLAVSLPVFIFAMRPRADVVAGLAWFGITILPVIGLIQIGEQSMADRYMYLPHIGLFFALTAWVDDMSRGVGVRLVQLAATVVVGLFAILAMNQAYLWRNAIELLEHTVAVTEHGRLFGILNPEARAFLGLAYWQRGVELNDAGSAEATDYWNRAELAFRSCLAERPKNLRSWNSLSVVYFSLGRYDAARVCAETTLELGGDKGSAYHVLGMIAAESGDIRGAITNYGRAVKESPRSPQLHVLLAYSLARAPDSLRDYKRAEFHLRRAIELNSRLVDSHLELARVLSETGRNEEAIQQVDTLLAIDPKCVTAVELRARLAAGKN